MNSCYKNLKVGDLVEVKVHRYGSWVYSGATTFDRKEMYEVKIFLNGIPVVRRCVPNGGTCQQISLELFDEFIIRVVKKK